MKIVIIKRENCGQKYLFKVPQDKTLNAGDVVLIDTKKGVTLGICMCDSFDIQSDNVLTSISQAFGIKEPITNVLGKYKFEPWNVDFENII